MNSTETRKERTISELLGDVEVWTIADGPEGWIRWSHIAVRRRYNHVEVHYLTRYGEIGDIVGFIDLKEVDEDEDHRQIVRDYLEERQTEIRRCRNSWG